MAIYLKCFLVVAACCAYSALGSLIICEWTAKTLTCPAGQTLRVSSAVFGRTKGICVCPSQSIANTNCTSPPSDTLAKVRTECEGKPTCTLYASIYIYGDPCPFTFKYLEVMHTCA